MADTLGTHCECCIVDEAGVRTVMDGEDQACFIDRHIDDDAFAGEGSI